MNVVLGDSLVRNVGGSVLQGHRVGDGENAPFLDGTRETTSRLTLAFEYEPVREIWLTGSAEWQYRKEYADAAGVSTLGLRAGIRMEY